MAVAIACVTRLELNAARVEVGRERGTFCESDTEAKPVRCCWTGCSCGSPTNAGGAETLELDPSGLTSPMRQSQRAGAMVRKYGITMGVV